jgi:hypothetical protein
LPKYQLWDYKISLKEKADPPFLLLQQHNKKEIKLQKKYINKTLSKNWIRKLYSLVGVVMLFIEKKNKLLKFYINFKKLNNLIIKN